MLSRWPIAAATPLAALAIAALVAAQDIPRQDWKDIAVDRAPGLFPLYEEAGKQVRAIFEGNARWAVLPRGIRVVHVQPDQPPCFEMHFTEGVYYAEHGGNSAVARWAATQTWDDQFRLLYNSALVARGGKEMWLRMPGALDAVRHFDGEEWTTYRLAGNEPREDRASTLAPAGKGKWWWATGSGLFLAEQGTLRRAKISNWPGGAAGGVISRPDGKAVAWSKADFRAEITTAETSVAFFEKDVWTSVKVPGYRRWLQAALRSDGSAVLLGWQSAAVAPAPEAGQSKPRDAADLERLKTGQFSIGGEWVQPAGSFAVTSNSDVLFAASKRPGNTYGFVHCPNGKPPQWIPSSAALDAHIAAGPDDGFVILGGDGSVLQLAAASDKLQTIAGTEETMAEDRLLGCDKHGRIYFQRDQAIVALLPDGKAAVPLAASVAAESVDERAPHLTAALDSDGNPWFIDRTHKVMTLRAAEEKPTPVDERLRHAESLWPGVDGSMLILCANGKGAIALKEGLLISADSLPELAELEGEKMHAAAPRASRDVRFTPRRSDTFIPRRIAPPWLSVGGSLYLSTGQQVYRWREKKVELVCEGSFELLGPLAGGQVLLASARGNSVYVGDPSDLTTWKVIEDPDGEAKALPLTPPPSEQNGAILSAPASIAGPWLLDSQGFLWLRWHHDSVYRIKTTAKWTWLARNGIPELEHPAGTIWALRSEGTFDGYQLSEGDSRRPCRPTYLDHLTPLSGAGESVVCLTPLGLAQLRMSQDREEDDAVADSVTVHFGGAPRTYLGRSGDRLWFVVMSTLPIRSHRHKLASVHLPEAWR